MVTNLFMRLVNAIEKAWSREKRVNAGTVPGVGQMRGRSGSIPVAVRRTTRSRFDKLNVSALESTISYAVTLSPSKGERFA